MHRTLATILILVSGFLLFWRLGETPIWRDEATAAVWARAMAEHDSLIPRVSYDGQLMVQADDGHDVNSKLLPAMQSYSQFYVAALSFELLGVDEWTARLPFALAGALTLFVLWRTGVVLFGPGVLALVPPGLAATSILFLQAARQCRYYILVGLFAALAMYEICRYLNDRSLARERSFYLRLGAWGLLLYLSNYVSFLGMWTAVGLWVLWQRDVRLIRSFIAMCAVLAVIVTADFLALHAEFATSWPPPGNDSLLTVFQGKLTQRARDFWRAIPLVLLVPAGLVLAWERGRRSAWQGAAAALATAMVWSGFVWSQADWAAAAPSLFWAGAAACLSIPAAAYWMSGGGSNLGASNLGVWGRAAVLAGLILIMGPLITIAAVQSKALTRHYYQILPASILLSSLVVAGVAGSGRKRAATALFAGLALWPSLDPGFGGTEEVVWRQYHADRSYVGPLLDMLDEHVGAGDRVAFLRNVKGMTAYFYRPDIRWVASLNADAPHNQQFRGKIPDDQFDDCDCADWYVVWDPRGATPKGLDLEKFELTASESYSAWLGWWDLGKTPNVRTYELWRRIEPSAPNARP